MDPKKIKVNVKSQKEIKRMKRDAILTVATPVSVKESSDYASEGQKMASGDIICLAGTWLRPGDECLDLPDKQVLRDDSIAHGQYRGGGILMYIIQDYRMIK